jgi:serine/threonine protein kinase
MKNQKGIAELLDSISIEHNNLKYYLLLFKYCKYKTLLNILQQNNQNKQILPDCIIYKYIYQIASGIKSIHDNNYCHRNICPDIILINEEDHLNIFDFSSATDHFSTSIINEDNFNNKLYEISLLTNPFYRAPEEIEIFSGHPLNKKVDIYALGIILFMMLFSYVPSIKDNYSHFFLITSKKIMLQIFKKIKSLCNPYLTELLGNILKINPEERYNIDKVLNFLKLNENKIINSEISNVHEKFEFSKDFNIKLQKLEKDYISSNRPNISILTRNLLESDFGYTNNINLPDDSYIDMIIKKINQKQKSNKLIKFYTKLFCCYVFFNNIYVIKMSYILNYFLYKYSIFNNNDIIFPNNFDIEEMLKKLIEYYHNKIINDFFGKFEIKDSQVNNFIVLYLEYLIKKVSFTKKYSKLAQVDNM